MLIIALINVMTSGNLFSSGNENVSSKGQFETLCASQLLDATTVRERERALKGRPRPRRPLILAKCADQWLINRSTQIINQIEGGGGGGLFYIEIAQK